MIRETAVADDGDIVVALVEDAEATLKTFRRKGSSIALEAANPAYETRVVPADKVNLMRQIVQCKLLLNFKVRIAMELNDV